MAKKNKQIYIFDKKKEDISFLKHFFRQKEGYSPVFFTNKRLLTKRLQDSPPDLIITDSPKGLSNMHELMNSTPAVALISSSISEGLRNAVRYNINCYLISPFGEQDFHKRIQTALKGKSWFQTLYLQNKELETIVEISYLVSSTLNPKEVLYFIVKKISEMIDVTRCSILSMGYREKRYAYVVSSYEDPAINRIKLDLKKYPEIKRVINTKRPIVINNAMRDKIMNAVKKIIAPIGIKSIMVIPIIFGDEVIGTLFLRTSKATSAFTEKEKRLCNAIANVASNALFNAFLFERLESEKHHLETLAITDYLTGIYNIRYLYHRLEEEMSRANRYRSTIGCIMMDIDYFKKINDTYGHKTGDLVLREFAQLVKRHTRKSDVFARYGGEEFILMLPQTTSHGSVIEAERLMNIIRNHKFDGIRKGAITVSMGIGHYPDKRIQGYEDLITLADNALFKAKNKGRNAIIINHQHLNNI